MRTAGDGRDAEGEVRNQKLEIKRQNGGGGDAVSRYPKAVGCKQFAVGGLLAALARDGAGWYYCSGVLYFPGFRTYVCLYGAATPSEFVSTLPIVGWKRSVR